MPVGRENHEATVTESSGSGIPRRTTHPAPGQGKRKPLASTNAGTHGGSAPRKMDPPPRTSTIQLQKTSGAGATRRTTSPGLKRRGGGGAAKKKDSRAEIKSPDSEALLAFTHTQAEAKQKEIELVGGTDLDEESVEVSDSGHIRVYARLRPCGEFNRIRNDTECITVRGTDKLVVEDDRRSVSPVEYKYDHVFEQHVQQDEVYAEACRPLVDSVMRGYNGTLMAYGQTGSGKTHTMGSMAAYSATDGYSSGSNDGLMSRVIDDVFDRTRADTDYKYDIFFSYVQIYQEEIYDLLCHDSTAKTPLALREHPSSGLFIEGVKEQKVDTPAEVKSLLAAGRRRLVVAETKMNRQSSRSHAISTLKVKKLHVKEDPKDEDEQDLLVCGKLILADLAGSERVKKSESGGQRLIEAQRINSSLLELGNVVSALADPSSTHVPFRNSTLTRMLQESLGGNCKTSLIVCCSTLSRDASETKGALHFGQRAKSVKQKARINVELDYRHLANELATELERKTEAWNKVSAKLKKRIVDLEGDLEKEKGTHLEARNELIKKLAEAHRDREVGVTAVEEDMLFKLAEQETLAAEREAELQQQLRKLKDQSAAVAMKTASQMATARKKRKAAEAVTAARIDELQTENGLLQELVSELEENIAVAQAETHTHREVVAKTEASAESTVAELQARIHATQQRLAETEARAADELAAEVQRGEAAVAAREAEVRALLPQQVEAEAARLRSEIEREVRSEAAAEQAEWVAGAEARAVEAQRELDDRVSAEKAAWLADQAEETEKHRGDLSIAMRAELEATVARLERERDAELAASKETWVAEQARGRVEAVANAVARQSIAHAVTEVPKTVALEETVKNYQGIVDALHNELEKMQRENQGLRDEVAGLKVDNGGLQDAVDKLQAQEDFHRKEECRLKEELAAKETVVNAAFQPTDVVKSSDDEGPEKKKKKKFLMCC
eukprot:m.38503 g.38503  ORF g.38503 m.38503 type:complete len:960 (-) comp7841_c0_seq1:149-3028(-)